MQRRRDRPSRDRVGDDLEILVVPFDPVEWPDRIEILAVVAGNVTHLHPEWNVRVPRHDVLDGVERAVDVAQCADLHLTMRRGRAGGLEPQAGPRMGRAARPYPLR